ncbi:MAG TPA: hypothetical protein VJ672_11555 [Gemmatimonadaceae bacterium]|nr:hypothetical protein [Gemmatimonadaceae bacterium]
MSYRRMLVALPALALVAMGAGSAAHTPAANVVTITARDYAFEAPDTIQAGTTTFQLDNKGPEFHHIWLVRLDEGKTFADFSAAMSAGAHGMPSWAVDVGGPQPATPGTITNASVDLAPGNYLILCVIPSKDGKPHVMKGMVRPLTVVAAKSNASTAKPAVADKPDVEIALADYGFKFSKPITAGRHRIRFTNDAAQSHEAFIVKLAPGKSVNDMIAFLEKMEGTPPGAPMGGITGIAKGIENTIEMTFTPGEYGLICFIPDAKDGKPHFVHGMVHQFTVR